ncbi:MAG: hypothetical protein HZB51_33440 [Chloroflexi bacterium]|nr:hypothetical protein [Chloroflexota bacterium]
MDADDIVLVALMNNSRDMEIVRGEHWYRIPAKHAPAHVSQARYVAFYLTKPFGDCKWSIHEYAPVRGHELVRRRDLFPDQADHPRAEEAYYKLELGSLIELKRPITSRSGRRILYLWTTGDKFSRAVEINDLLGRSDEDDALWDALKASKIDAERQIVVRDKRARYRVDFWIQCTRGNLAVVLGDVPRKMPKGTSWRTLQFSTRQLEQNLTDCAHQVSKMIKELGGTKYNAEKNP